jgi:2-C-methyl-D-erythritol 4-phosphate cytidylyltransferase
MNDRVAALIPAAGSGRRMRSSTPKQFLPIAGIPLLVHTLKVFESSSLIHEIYLVVPRGMETACRINLLEPYGFKKVTHVVPGGETRQESVYRALDSIAPEVLRVVVHDGARPFLTAPLLQQVLEAATEEAGAIAAVPLRDTPKYVGEDGVVLSTLDRTRIYLAQTPQVFPKKILMEAYRRAYAEGIHSTDDASLVERMGFPVRVVGGSWDNIKITTAEDLHLAENIIEMRRQNEAGN